MTSNEDHGPKGIPSSIELYGDVLEKLRLVAAEEKLPVSIVVRKSTDECLKFLMHFVNRNKLPEKTSGKPTKINVRFSKEEKEMAKIIEEELRISFSDIVRIAVGRRLNQEPEGIKDGKESSSDANLQ